MVTLSENPRHITCLSDDSFTRVMAKHPNTPSGPGACITCRGQGTFPWYAPGSRDQVVDYECDCPGQYKLHLWMLDRGVTLNYQRLSWMDADGMEPAAVELLHEYRDNSESYVRSGIGLIMHGTRGAGKTMGSALLTKSLIHQGHDVFFLTFQEFLDTFTDGWSRNESGREAQAWFERRIRNAGVLVLDDLGREYSGRSQIAESILDHVLRFRVGDQRPTVLTTNRTLEDLKNLYSSNAMSLLSEASIAHEFSGEDYRVRAQGRRVAEVRQGLIRPVVFA